MTTARDKTNGMTELASQQTTRSENIIHPASSLLSHFSLSVTMQKNLECFAPKHMKLDRQRPEITTHAPLYTV